MSAMLFKLKVVFYYLKLRFEKKFNGKDHLTRHQLKQMKKYARSVLIKSPFYRRYFKDKVMVWDNLPMVDKTFYMERFDDINTAGIKKDDAMKLALASEKSRDFTPEINGITIGLSTGTSGKRGIFLVSENERAKWAAMMMHKIIRPKLFKKQKISFFLRANSNLYESVNSIFFQFKYYDIFIPVEDHIKDLNTYNPDILAAQPSILFELAILKSKKKVRINPVKIISFAEVLHDSEKIFIEDIFNCKISEVYQCTEGLLGFSCDHGVMHLNERFIHFQKEYIEGRRFYPVITDFARETQPIVKYKMNDILIERETPCPCGSHFQAIEKIEGREDDILLFIKDNQLIKLFPDIISRKIAHFTDNFSRYKIEQVDFNALHLFIETEHIANTREMFTTALLELFAERKISDVLLFFYDNVKHTPGSKYRRIQRSIPAGVFNSRIEGLPS